MKKKGILILLCICCLTLTACSPYDLKYKWQDIRTDLDRNWTKFRLWFEDEWKDAKNRLNLEKDNATELWDNRNLDKDDAKDVEMPEGQKPDLLKDYENSESDTQKVEQQVEEMPNSVETESNETEVEQN